MKKTICKIFGHKTILRGWYPSDSISKVECLRCGETIDMYPNPWYNAANLQPPWNDNENIVNLQPPWND